MTDEECPSHHPEPDNQALCQRTLPQLLGARPHGPTPGALPVTALYKQGGTFYDRQSIGDALLSTRKHRYTDVDPGDRCVLAQGSAVSYVTATHSFSKVTGRL